MNSSNKLTSYQFFNDTAVITYSCTRKTSGTIAIVFAFTTSPVYILMFTVLIYRFKLSLPRHKILLSLNISDSIQIVGIAVLQILALVFQESNSTGCQVIRKFIEFLGIATVVSASSSIILLSFERYVACVHCLRLHDIVTDDLVHRALYCIWGAAFICGLADKERYEKNYSAASVVLTKSISIIYTVVVFLSTVVLAFVQIRLYRLSYKKIKVVPDNSFGREAEEHDNRRAHMKVAVVASAVVGLYVICMCPLAFYIISVGFDSKNDTSAFKTVFILLAQVNTVANPFVYGFGMVDTRQQILMELRKMKTALVDFINGIFNP